MFSFSNGSLFDGLCDVVRSKFTDLASGDFELKYVLLGSDPCVLCNDDDMTFMYPFFPIVRSEHVELIIKRICTTHVETGIVIPNVDPEFNLFIDVDIMDNSVGMVFLCEAWKGLISHVQQRFPLGVLNFRN